MISIQKRGCLHGALFLKRSRMPTPKVRVTVDLEEEQYQDLQKIMEWEGINQTEAVKFAIISTKNHLEATKESDG